MKQNRGQATIEFLFTYGWAILIILIVALVVWQMGLFNIGGRVQPGSSGFWGVTPSNDMAYSDDGGDGMLIMAINNQVGANVTLKNITARIQGDRYTANNINQVISTGETFKWTSPSGWVAEDGATRIPMLPRGSSFNFFITINYTDSRTSEGYSSSGWVWGNVEEQGAA